MKNSYMNYERGLLYEVNPVYRFLPLLATAAGLGRQGFDEFRSVQGCTTLL